jgi:pantoate--beta-alanine ligase
MIIHQLAEKLKKHLQEQKEKGLSIGFVPTMGALHEGHISLIRQAVGNSDLVVCSIFVNPTQFNDPKDFAKYPATLGSDLDLLYRAGVAAVFVPTVEDIYPNGTDVENSFDLDGLDKRIEGKFRPGHFQGVCQVVFRLLDIVRPHSLFMGQKDYQQCMVIRKMLEVKNLPTELVICRTVRENSGLAMSSRNMRLTEPQKVQAALIYKVLSEIKEGITSGRFEWLKSRAIQELTDGGFNVDYIEIVNAVDLSWVEDGDRESPLVALAAAFLGEVRLIDNLVVR